MIRIHPLSTVALLCALAVGCERDAGVPPRSAAHDAATYGRMAAALADSCDDVPASAPAPGWLTGGLVATSASPASASFDADVGAAALVILQNGDGFGTGAAASASAVLNGTSIGSVSSSSVPLVTAIASLAASNTLGVSVSGAGSVRTSVAALDDLPCPLSDVSLTVPASGSVSSTHAVTRPDGGALGVAVITASGLTSGTVTLNGTTIADASALTASSAPFAVPLSLAAENSISIEVEGSEGAVVHMTVVDVDTLAPQVALTSPSTDPTTDSSPLATEGTAAADAVAVDVSGVAATLAGGAFSADVTLAVGAHAIVAAARDSCGNTSNACRVVTFRPPPHIVVSGVTDGAAVDAPVTVSWSDTSGVPGTTLAATLDGSAIASGAEVSAEGAHHLVVTATPSVGGTVTKSVDFTLDFTNPAITVSGATDGAFAAGDVTLSFGATDATLAGITATLDGVSFASGGTVHAEGSHVLEVNATDRAGHAAQRAVSFAIDRTAPTITIGGVHDGQASNAASLPPTFGATDANLAAVSATLDGESFASGTPVETDGLHVLVVTATDLAGNTSVLSAAFLLDHSTPVISVTGVSDGALTGGAVSIAWDVDDPYGGTSSEALLDGAPFTGGTVSAEGTHVLEVNASSPGGNVGSAVVHFTIDRTAPAISVTGVVDGQLGHVAVSPAFDVADAHLSSATATLDGEAFASGTTVTAEGAHVLTIDATDAAGNAAQATVHFTIDKTAPVITLTGVTEALISNASALTPAFSASDGTLDATLDGAAFTGGTPVATEGAHVLAVSATDAAGNASQVTVHFTIDRTAPVLTLAAPADGGRVHTPVTLTFSAADPRLTTTSATLDGATFASGGMVSSAGAHVFAVTATDDAGNESHETRHFTLDFTPPTVVVSAPEAGALVTSSSIAVSATVTDDGPLGTVAVGGATLTCEGSSCSGTVPLVEGTNQLVVDAFDVAGNHASSTVSVVRDSTAPALSVTAPADNLVIQSPRVNVAGTVTDATATTVEIAGTRVNVGPGGSFAYAAALVTGENDLVVVATDATGNRSTLSRHVTVQSPPTLILTSPTSGTTTTDPVVLVTGRATTTAAGAATLLVQNRPVAVGSDGSFSTSVTLIEGRNVISCVYTDGQGLQASATTTVTRGTGTGGGAAGGTEGGSGSGSGGTTEGSGSEGTAAPSAPPVPAAPTLVWTLPADGAVMAGATVAVTAIVVDGSAPFTATVNGRSASVSGHSVTAGLALPEGEHTLDLTISDSLGRTASATRTLSIDRHAPYLSVTRPTAPTGTVMESPYLVQGLVDDPHLAGLFINGVPVPVLAGGFSTSVPLVPGANGVLVEARDLAGNVASTGLVLTLTGTPPTVAVTAPASRSEITTSTVEVHARVTSATALESVTIGGATAHLDADGTWVATLVLTLGDNTIVVAATDAAGLTGTGSVTVHHSDPLFEPLRVLSILPAAGESGVVTDSVVQVTFNKAVDAASLKAAFKVSANGADIPGGVALAHGGQTASFIAADALPVGATVNVSVAGATATTGPGQEDDFTSTFTVRPPQTIVRGVVLDEQFRPLGGVTVTVGSVAPVVTGRDGNWAILGAPAGQTVVTYKGGIGFGGASYPTVSRALFVEAGREVVDRPVTLVPTEETSAQLVDASQAVSVTFNGTVPGFEVDLDPHALVFPDGSSRGYLTLTEWPSALVPIRSDTGFVPPHVWQVGPAGHELHGVNTLFFPNDEHLAAGRHVMILTFDPTNPRFVIAGVGVVGADGTRIESAGDLSSAVKSLEFVGYFPLTPQQESAYDDLIARTKHGALERRHLRPAPRPVPPSLFDLFWPVPVAHASVPYDFPWVSIAELYGFITRDAYYDPSGPSLVTGWVTLPQYRRAEMTLGGDLATAGGSQVVSGPLPLKRAIVIEGSLTFNDLDAAAELTTAFSATSAGRVLAPPAAEQRPWVVRGVGSPVQARVESTVALDEGVTELTARVESGFDVQEAHFRATVSPSSQHDANGAPMWTYTVEQLSRTPSPPPTTTIPGAVANATVSIVPTGYATTTDAEGKYRIVLPRVWPEDEGFAEVQVPFGLRAVGYPITPPGGLFVGYRRGTDPDTRGLSPHPTLVSVEYIAISQEYPLRQMLLPLVANVGIDVRALVGKLTMVDAHGAPLPPLAATRPTTRDPATGLVTSISAEDMATTEVHFFRERDLTTPIAMYAIALPNPGGTPEEPWHGSYARLHTGPIDQAKLQFNRRCRAMRADGLTGTDDYRRLCLSDVCRQLANDNKSHTAEYRAKCGGDGDISAPFLVRLKEGEVVYVYAINHATGYSGIKRVVVPYVRTRSDGTCSAYDEDGVEIQSDALDVPGSGIDSAYKGKLGDCLKVRGDVKLFPPEIEVEVKRKVHEDGVAAPHRPATIRHGGLATTQDEWISVETRWRVRRDPADVVAEGGDPTPPVAGVDAPSGREIPDAGTRGPAIDDLDTGAAAGPLETYCSELPSGGDRRHCFERVPLLVDVPPGVPPLEGRVTSVGAGQAQYFHIQPGKKTAHLNASLRLQSDDGTTNIIASSVNPATYYVHVVGYPLHPPADAEGDPTAQPPPDFNEGPGTPEGLPAKAISLKNVFLAHLDDGSVRPYFDRSVEHEFRIVDLKNGDAVVTAKGGSPDAGYTGEDGSRNVNQGAGSRAWPTDDEYELLLTMSEPTSGRATLPGSTTVRLGTDEDGLTCEILPTQTGKLKARCRGDELSDVLSADDLLYLEAVLGGNVDNPIYRFNFEGLSKRVDYVTAGTRDLAVRALHRDAADGTPTNRRPISRPATVTVGIDPLQTKCGVIAIKSCPPGTTPLSDAIATTTNDAACNPAAAAVPTDGCELLAATHFAFGGENDALTTAIVAGGRDGLTLQPRGDLDGSSSRLFSVRVPNDLGKLGDLSASENEIWVAYNGVESGKEAAPAGGGGNARMVPSAENFGRPEGVFESEAAAPVGHESQDGVDVADGHLVLAHTDLDIPEGIGRVAFTRVYDNQRNLTGTLGQGWTHNYEGWVHEERAPKTTVHGEINGRYTVVLSGQSYDFPSCSSDRLTSEDIDDGCRGDGSHGGRLVASAFSVNGVTSFTFRRDDGAQYTFATIVGRNDVEGRRRWYLSTIDDGLVANVKYLNDDSKYVAAVVWADSAGRTNLAFDYEVGSRRLNLRKVEVRHRDVVVDSVKFGYDDDADPSAHGLLVTADRSVAGAETTTKYTQWKYKYLDTTSALQRNELTRVAFLVGRTSDALVTYASTDYGRPGESTCAVGQAGIFAHEDPHEVVGCLSKSSDLTANLDGAGPALQTKIAYDAVDTRTLTIPGLATNVTLTLNSYGSVTSRVIGTRSWTSTWFNDADTAIEPLASSPRLVRVEFATAPNGRRIKYQYDSGRLVTRAVNLDTLPNHDDGDEVSSTTYASGPLWQATELDARWGAPTKQVFGQGTGQTTLESPLDPVSGVAVKTTAYRGDPISATRFHVGESVQSGHAWPGSGTLGTGATVSYAMAGAGKDFGIPGTKTIAKGDNRIHDLTYDSLGRPTGSKERLTGAERAVSYDILGRVVAEFVAGTPAQSWVYSYVDTDNKTVVTATLNGEVRSQKTYRGGLLVEETTSRASGALWTRYAFVAGRLSTMTVHNGGGRADTTTTYVEYADGRGLQSESVSDTAGTGGGVTYVRDREGKVISRTTPDGSTVSYAYDPLGNEAIVTSGSGTLVSRQYDLATGRVVVETDGGRSFETTVDAIGRPTRLTSTDNSVDVSFTGSDGSGTIDSVTDNKTNVRTTSVHDDPYNRETRSKVEELPGTSSDEAHRSWFETIYEIAAGGTGTASGETVNATERFSVPAGQTSAGQASTTIVTDAAGRAKSISEPLGAGSIDTLIELNEFGQVLSETRGKPGQPPAATSSHGYDIDGSPVFHTSGTRRVDVTTDISGLTTQIKGPLASQEKNVTYDAVGRPTTVADKRTDRPAAVTTADYGTPYQVKIARPGGNTTVTSDDFGRPRSFTTHVGSSDRTTSLLYQGQQLAQMDVSEGQWHSSVTTAINAAGKPTRITKSWSAPKPGGAGTAGATHDTRIDWTTARQPILKDVVPNTETILRQRRVTLDGLGRVTSVAVKDGTWKNTVSSTYDGRGMQLAAKDELTGQTTTASYGADGEAITVLSGGGQTTTARDASGHPACETDQAGRTTRYRYDSSGRVTAKAYGANLPRCLQFGAPPPSAPAHPWEPQASELIVKDITEGATGPVDVTLYGYTGGEEKPTIEIRAAQMTAGHGRVTWKYGYDSRGALAFVTMPISGPNTICYAYDDEGRLWKISQPVADTCTGAFSGVAAQEFAYDALGRMITRKRGGLMLFNSTYADGTEVRTKHAAYTDEDDNEFPDDTITTLYDPDGRPAERIFSPRPSAVGRASSYTYDAVGHLSSILEVFGGTRLVETSFEYDAFGRLTKKTRPEGVVGFDRVFGAEEDDPPSVKVVETVTTPHGVQKRKFDENNRLLSISGAGSTTDVAWEPGSERLLCLEDRNGGLAERRCYDAQGRVTRVVNLPSASAGDPCTDANESALQQYDYEYDVRGNQVKETYRAAGGTPEVTWYGYDEADRLTGVRYNDGHAELYELDGAGSRTGEKWVDNYPVGGDTGPALGPAAYAAALNPTKWLRYDLAEDGSGRLTRIKDQLTSETYASVTNDGAGRMLAFQILNGAGRQFIWDSDDRMVGAKVKVNGVTQDYAYEYDASGMRVRAQGPGANAAYVWGNGELLEEQDLSNDQTYHYLRHGDLVIGADKYASAALADSERFLNTPLGSVVGRWSPSAGLIAAHRFGAWGGYQGGIAPTGPPTLGYATHQWESGPGLVYAKARWYAPELGRFLSEDPVGVTRDRLASPMGLASFGYANANPLRWNDPDGRDVFGDPWGSFFFFQGLAVGDRDSHDAQLVLHEMVWKSDVADTMLRRVPVEYALATHAAINDGTHEACVGAGTVLMEAEQRGGVSNGLAGADGALVASACDFVTGIALQPINAPLYPYQLYTSPGRIQSGVAQVKHGVEANDSEQIWYGTATLGGELALWAGTASMSMKAVGTRGPSISPRALMSRINPFSYIEFYIDSDPNQLNTGVPIGVRAKRTTRQGIIRTNASDWRMWRDVWERAGLGDILSEDNKKAIAEGRTPTVDDDWIRHFPGDEMYKGDKIPMHHIEGGRLDVPLPEKRHLDAHMPGGFRRNPGGPGQSG